MTDTNIPTLANPANPAVPPNPQVPPKQSEVTVQGGDPVPPPPSSDSWLGKNMAPIIALITIILTFGMFVYFVSMANTPTPESKEYQSLHKSLLESKRKFSQISSATTSPKEFALKDELKKEINMLCTQIITAKDAADDAKDRRGMVKDFVLYILGVLSSALTTIFGYYFGSSKGSAVKTEALNAMAIKGQSQNVVAGK